MPTWNSDIGAFFISGRGGTFPQGVADPAYQELYLRWFQFSTFCPIMRSHGTQTPREIWQFGEPGDIIYDSLANFARLRMRLLSYSYSLAAAATNRAYTPMRALVMDFAEDQEVHPISDQYCYGPALMACPVHEAMVHAPSVKSDALTVWFDTRVGEERRMRLQVFDGIDATDASYDQLVKHEADYNWNGELPDGCTVKTIVWR